MVVNGKVSYKRGKLDPENYDPSFEKTVYDAAYYEHYRELLKAGVPFIRRFFLTVLPPFESVIDIGCGTGDFIAPMIAEGKDVLGVDFSVGSVEINVLGDRFRNIDITKPFDLGRKFDVLTSFEVYEHIPAGTAEKQYLENIKNIGANYMIISCAGMKVAGKDTGELYPKLEKQWGRRHYNCLTLEDFASRVCALGYEVDGLKTVQWSKTPAIPGYLKHNTVVFKKLGVA